MEKIDGCRIKNLGFSSSECQMVVAMKQVQNLPAHQYDTDMDRTSCIAKIDRGHSGSVSAKVLKSESAVSVFLPRTVAFFVSLICSTGVWPFPTGIF